jgi:hypothetical protein
MDLKKSIHEAVARGARKINSLFSHLDEVVGPRPEVPKHDAPVTEFGRVRQALITRLQVLRTLPALSKDEHGDLTAELRWVEEDLAKLEHELAIKMAMEPGVRVAASDFDAAVEAKNAIEAEITERLRSDNSDESAAWCFEARRKAERRLANAERGMAVIVKAIPPHTGPSTEHELNKARTAWDAKRIRVAQQKSATAAIKDVAERLRVECSVLVEEAELSALERAKEKAEAAHQANLDRVAAAKRALIEGRVP